MQLESAGHPTKSLLIAAMLDSGIPSINNGDCGKGEMITGGIESICAALGVLLQHTSRPESPQGLPNSIN